MWMPSSRRNDALDNIHNEALSGDTDTRLLPEIFFHLLVSQYNWICVCFYLPESSKLASEKMTTSSAFPAGPNHLYYEYQASLTKHLSTLLPSWSPSFFLWVPSSHPVCISLCSHTPSNQSRLLSSVKFLTSLHLLLWLNGHGTLLCDPSIMRVSHCMSVGSVYTKWTTGNLIFSSANNFNLPIKLLLSAQYHLTGYEYVFFYVWMCVCVCILLVRLLKCESVGMGMSVYTNITPDTSPRVHFHRFKKHHFLNKTCNTSRDIFNSK